MDRHEWTDDGISYAADAKDGGRLAAQLPSLEECPAALPDYADQVHRQRAVSGAAREILRLAEENAALKRVGGFDRIGADRLADEVASLVARGLLDSRSGAADALLDYREPPRTERSDRLAELESERDRLAAELEKQRTETVEQARLLHERINEAHQKTTAAGRELTRLAKEVERLNERLVLLTDEESQWQAKKVIEAAERARIRLELLEELSANQHVALGEVRAALDRIVPEEG